MPNTIEIPLELTHFQLPEAVQERLQALLDRQDAGESLTPSERQEAAGLVEVSEFLSLLHLRAQRVTGQA
jgi:ribosome assembly protein YihI (activator of Der GTPase)